MLGVTTTDTDEGIVVSGVVAESNAAKAGLKDNDIITKIAGTMVNERAEISTALTKFDPDDSVSLDVKRGEKTETLEVKLSAR